MTALQKLAACVTQYHEKTGRVPGCVVVSTTDFKELQTDPSLDPSTPADALPALCRGIRILPDGCVGPLPVALDDPMPDLPSLR